MLDNLLERAAHLLVRFDAIPESAEVKLAEPLFNHIDLR